jgi:hypothetical protein
MGSAYAQLVHIYLDQNAKNALLFAKIVQFMLVLNARKEAI